MTVRTYVSTPEAHSKPAPHRHLFNGPGFSQLCSTSDFKVCFLWPPIRIPTRHQFPPLGLEGEEPLVAAEHEDLETSQQLLESHKPPIKLEQARRIWINRFEPLFVAAQYLGG